jgi:lipoate-protein ligase B
MNIEVKNSVKPVDYRKSIQFLEERVKEVISGKKKELLWILEHNTV